MKRVGLILAASVVGACALAGCTGSEGGVPTNGPSASKTTTPVGTPFSVEAALRELPLVEPAGDQPLQVFASDLSRAAALGDLPKPVDKQSTATWFRGLNGPKVSITGGEGLGLPRLQTDAMRNVLGFDARDVATVSSVESLPDAVTVVHLSDGVSPKRVSTTGDGKIGDVDPAGARDAPFPQIFGVAQRGDRVVLAKTQRMLDAWKSQGDTSLADHEPFLEVARALDSHRVYDVVLSDRPNKAPWFSQQVHDDVQASMPEFGAVGVAATVEDGEAVEYIAYQVKDVAEAEARIAAVWEDGFSVYTNSWFDELLDVEDVSTRGNVVMVKIVSESGSGVAARMLLSSDTAFFVVE